MEYKRLLVIGHNCLSKTGSNGRTLANFLRGWPKEKLAQFYMHPESPDTELCEKFFCLTDMSVLCGILNRKPVQSTKYTETETLTGIKNSKVKKNSVLILVRDIAWKSMFWNRSSLEKWVDDYNPEIILVQAGDAGFLFTFARKISKKYDAPIIVYNTEGYYFKKHSYFLENRLTKLIYPLIHKRFQRDYDRLIKDSKVQIYNCHKLCNDFEAVYGTGSHLIMTASEFTNESVCSEKKRQIVYAGNLTLNRHQCLMEFAKMLGEVAPDLYLDVYGKVPDEVVRRELEECNRIRFHGFISYEELKKILVQSRFLVHVESFEAFYQEDLKYAFSTKIADGLASGACLFVYAPENMAVSCYLKDSDAAVLVNSKDQLAEKLAKYIDDPSASAMVAQAGRKLAEENHNIETNRMAFQKLLLQ